MTDGNAVTRRSLFAVGGAAGAVILTGCSAGQVTPTPSSTPSGNGKGDTVALSSIPVGGGASAMLNGAPVVLEQPKEGTVVAFSAICPHQGCVVAPAGDRFDCPCHGSRFDGATGAVLHGPAARGLTALKTTVSGDTVTVA